MGRRVHQVDRCSRSMTAIGPTAGSSVRRLPEQIAGRAAPTPHKASWRAPMPKNIDKKQDKLVQDVRKTCERLKVWRRAFELRTKTGAVSSSLCPLSHFWLSSLSTAAYPGCVLTPSANARRVDARARLEAGDGRGSSPRRSTATTLATSPIRSKSPVPNGQIRHARMDSSKRRWTKSLRSNARRLRRWRKPIPWRQDLFLQRALVSSGCEMRLLC